MNEMNNSTSVSEVISTASSSDSNKASTNSVNRDYAPHRRVSIRICRKCGKTYILSDNDIKHYVKKYDTIPLHCEKCREKKYEKVDSKNI